MTALFTLMASTFLPFAILYFLEKKRIAQNTLNTTRRERYIWWTLTLIIIEFVILTYGLLYDRSVPKKELTQETFKISENYPISLLGTNDEPAYRFFTHERGMEGSEIKLRTSTENETSIIVEKSKTYPFFVKNNCDEFYRFDWVLFMKVKDNECQKINKNEIHIPKSYRIENLKSLD